jgi:hypothetical protein
VFNTITGVFHGNPLQHQHLARTTAIDRLLATAPTDINTDADQAGASPAPAFCQSGLAQQATNNG